MAGTSGTAQDTAPGRSESVRRASRSRTAAWIRTAAEAPDHPDPDRKAVRSAHRPMGNARRPWHCRAHPGQGRHYPTPERSEEHTSELQSLMRISYAVFCLKKKNRTHVRTLQHLPIYTHNTHSRT